MTTSVPKAVSTKSLTGVDIQTFTSFNRGPIMTPFVPPTSCTATLTLGQYKSNNYLNAGHGYGPLSQYFDPACYPIGRSDNKVADLNWSLYYYSPALCPYGWTTVTTLESIPLGGTTVATLDAQTTAAVCCPNGFMYSGLGHLCTSMMTENQVVSYIRPTNKGVSWERGSLSYSTLPAKTTAFADGVQLWWQSSDKAVLASVAAGASSIASMTTTQPTPISTTSSNASAASRTTSSRPSPTGDTSSGLSTGAKAGIGVGVPLAIIAVLLLGFIFWRRRNRKLDTHGLDLVQAETETKPSFQYLPQELHAHNPPSELYGTTKLRHELPQ